MANKHGSLSIDSDNLFPIIKKWLYSDHDIFYRELISNGCDAITKLKKLDMMGEYSLPADYKAKIQVIVNPEEKTLTFIDNGLGMTADEVEEYIGHAPGGVCPFGINEGVDVYLDESLRQFDTVYPAAGNDHSAVRLAVPELEKIAGAKGWINVCKEPEKPE